MSAQKQSFVSASARQDYHVNGSDKLSKAQVRKAIAGAKIIENKADKLTAGGKVNNLLQALLDVKSGGDGSNGTEV